MSRSASDDRRGGAARAPRAAARPIAERLVALRGATTVETDAPAALLDRTAELLRTLLARNGVEHDDLVSIVFTATEDLRSAFPAAAARAIGLGDIPLLCARELSIVGGNPSTVRVLVHCYSARRRADLHHIYLYGARGLRDDLPE